VFTALLAIPLLGERPTLVQAAGILLVVLGALVLSLPAGERLSPAAVLRAWGRDPGALWMIAVALLWSLSGPLDKLALGQSSGPFHGLVLHLGVAVATLLVLAVWRKLGELSDARGAGLHFLAAIGMGSLALALQLVAYQLVWVSLVETLKRGIGNLLAVLFGYLVFAEAVTLRKLAAVTLMAAGVALILI
jgi:drug/metabolite transporter (DMT)-like permease